MLSPDATINFALATSAILILFFVRKCYQRTKVYLVDFVTFSQPERCACTIDHFKQLQRKYPYTGESLEFMDRLHRGACLGARAAPAQVVVVAPAVHQVLNPGSVLAVDGDAVRARG